ncbi:hypothetical protein ACLM5H_00140 [Fredinandcohnia humi]
MGLDQVIGLLGLGLGASGGLLGLWWGRKQAAKNRGLDERYEIISSKALGMGWKITLVALYTFFILLNFGVKLSVAPVLGILVLVHMAGWAFSLVYYHLKI